MTKEGDRDWLIERVALGEAPPGVVLSESEQRRLEALEQDNERVLSAYPPSVVAAEVQRRLRTEAVVRAEARTSSPGRRWGWTMAPVLAAAVVVMVVAQPDQGSKLPMRVESVRLKGADLRIYRKTATGSEMLLRRQIAKAQDRLQIEYQLDRSAFGALLSLDGRGVVTVHLPAEGEPNAARLQAGKGRLPYSYELDDAPDFERFFMVTSLEPFETQLAVEAVERLGRIDVSVATKDNLSLPEGFTQIDFLVLKENQR